MARRWCSRHLNLQGMVQAPPRTWTKLYHMLQQRTLSILMNAGDSMEMETNFMQESRLQKKKGCLMTDDDEASCSHSSLPSFLLQSSFSSYLLKNRFVADHILRPSRQSAARIRPLLQQEVGYHHYSSRASRIGLLLPILMCERRGGFCRMMETMCNENDLETRVQVEEQQNSNRKMTVVDHRSERSLEEDDVRNVRREWDAKLVWSICNQMNQGEWGDEMMDTLEKLCSSRLKTKHVNSVVRQLDNVDMALNFFHWAGTLAGYSHSTYTYHAILERLGASQKFELQYQLFQDMHHQGYQISVATFNIVMVSFSRAKNTAGVLDTFNRMEEYGCSPNAFSFQCLIRSLVWSGEILKATEVYRQMLQFGFLPDNFTLNGLIDGLCNTGKVDLALIIFQDMEQRDFNPDAIAHAAVIRGLDKEGRIEEACRMFQEMTGKGLPAVVSTYKGPMGVFSKKHSLQHYAFMNAEKDPGSPAAG
jgi:pentatricopeptide repeat protein